MPQRRRSKRKIRSSARTAAIATLIVGFFVLFAVLRLSAARRDLFTAKGDVADAREALAHRDNDKAREALDSAGQSLHAARHSAGALPLALLRPLPVVGSPGRGATSAAKAGLEAVAAGRVLLAASASFPTNTAAGLDADDLSAFHGASVRSLDAVEGATRHVRLAGKLTAGPAGAALPFVSGPARSMRTEIAKTSSALNHAGKAFRLLADLTSPDADSRLLLLSQDTLELRATGGFIGSYGVLRFSHGSMKLEKYDAVENLPSPDPPVPPPAALEGKAPFFGLGNVNWWPNFPYTATAAREMFKREGGGDVDGVIALTELATARIIGAIGPLNLPSYPAPVVEKGFDQRVIHEVETKRPRDEPRKKFLIELSNVLFDRMFHLPAERLPQLADAIERSVSAGDIQLWFSTPERQRQIAGTTITGQLPLSPVGDFLMLVDTNFQASKANFGLVRDVSYDVRRQGKRLVATLVVQVANKGPDIEVNRNYSGLLRVYVPRGSRLQGHREGQGPMGPADDGPYDVFIQGFGVPLGEERVAVFDYILPPSVAPGQRYVLAWARQVGTPSDKLSATIFGANRSGPTEKRLMIVQSDLREKGLGAWLRRRWIVKKLRLGAVAVVGVPHPW